MRAFKRRAAGAAGRRERGQALTEYALLAFLLALALLLLVEGVFSRALGGHYHLVVRHLSLPFP